METNLEVLVIFDWAIQGEVWPSFHMIGGPEDRGLRDNRHRIMSVTAAGELLGNLRGSSNTGLPYTPVPPATIRRLMMAGL